MNVLKYRRPSAGVVGGRLFLFDCDFYQLGRAIQRPVEWGIFIDDKAVRIFLCGGDGVDPDPGFEPPSPNRPDT